MSTSEVVSPEIKTTSAPEVALPQNPLTKTQQVATTNTKAAIARTKAAPKSLPKSIKAVSKPVTKLVAKGVVSVPVSAKSIPAVEASASKVIGKKIAVAKAPKQAKPAKVEKTLKVKKPKMIRDSMTMPKAEYAVLGELKIRAAELMKPAKKTELLRAGIKALAAMTDASFLAALKAVPTLKTGRPFKK